MSQILETHSQSYFPQPDSHELLFEQFEEISIDTINRGRHLSACEGPLKNILEFFPSNGLARVNKTFYAYNLNLTIEKLKRFFSKEIEIKNPRLQQVIENMKKLFERFSYFPKSRPVTSILKETYQLLKKEIKILKLYQKTKNLIIRTAGTTNYFSYKNIITMFNQANIQSIDIRKTTKLSRFAITCIIISSLIAAALATVAIVFFIIFIVKIVIISKKKFAIYKNLVFRTLQEHYDKKIYGALVVLKYKPKIWVVFFNKAGHWQSSPFEIPKHISNIIDAAYNANSEVKALIALQKKILSSFFLTNSLPSMLVCMLTLLTLIPSIILLVKCCREKFNTKRNNPNIRVIE